MIFGMSIFFLSFCPYSFDSQFEYVVSNLVVSQGLSKYSSLGCKSVYIV